MAEAAGAAKAREAAACAALMEAARARQRGAHERSPAAPRFLLESARAMAAHLGMPPERMQACLEPMALWQLYLPAALGARTWDFAAVREHLPWSYERVRTALIALERRPQLACALFHMAAFPLVCPLIGAAWRELHEGPLHFLVAGRNLGWLRFGDSRWITDTVEVLSADRAGLRRLVSGLNDGSISRLLILADGPQPPGAAGARALTGVSPALAIKTGLLAKLHALGIPLVPVTHEWDAGRLAVTPHAALDPAAASQDEMIEAVAGRIEDLLRRRPEQWLNWGAARIRT